MVKINGEEHKRSFVFFKYCEGCGKKFKPTGKATKYCEKCAKDLFLEGIAKRDKRRKNEFKGI